MIDGYSNIPFGEQQTLSTHTQIQVQAPNGETIVVDEALVSLLHDLWGRGYDTRFSCQGGERDNALNTSPEDGSDSEGYIYFETEEMALSFFAVVHTLFPVDKYPLYYIDSRAFIRFKPSAIIMFEYAVRHFPGDMTVGSRDIGVCLAQIKFPDSTDAERRLLQRIIQLVPVKPVGTH